MYDRHCRHNLDTPTFEQFNQKHFTCLPHNPTVFNEYNSTISAAKKAVGIPVTRRLPSLYKKLSSTSSSIVKVVPQVQINSQLNSFKSTVPNMGSSLRMNIRTPAPVVVVPAVVPAVVPVVVPAVVPAVVPVVVPAVVPVGPVIPAVVPVGPVIPVAFDHPPVCWTKSSYKEAVRCNPSILLKESNGHMVHLVPFQQDGASFEGLACKLTKSIWETLRGKSMEPLKMRDGSSLQMSTISLDEGDLAEFVQNRKRKVLGPHFIRFSRI
tara:strand:- start:2508 stop:3308 length:801 start_codon:yes stop_codon:yes gene_type:complete